MSQENLEIARKAIKAWNAGDMSRLRVLYDPDATMRRPADWPEPGPFVGRDAVMAEFDTVRDIFGNDSSMDRLVFRDAGDFVAVSVDFHGDTRGLPLTTEIAWVYTVRKGLIIAVEFFGSKREALEAAGLSE